MSLIFVNQELCTKCGLCAAVCPNGMIEIGAEGPEELAGRNCIACGHCVAVCPQAALDNVKTPLANQAPLERFPVIDPQTAAQFLRARRSVRRYQKKQIPKERLLELLDIARFAPTGRNSQGLAYLVIQDRNILKQISVRTIECFEDQITRGTPWADGYSAVVATYRNTGNDVILREAPCLIVAIAPQDFIIGHDNARFSLEYVELYATTLSLGTCWAGFVELAAGTNYGPLLKAMRIPEGMAVAGAIMVGYPLYTYQRLVDRHPLQVTWV
jgi:nitroreductase/NAD-dependent dihydropyrimidine dehydrogenase PreA subunit